MSCIEYRRFVDESSVLAESFVPPKGSKFNICRTSCWVDLIEYDIFKYAITEADIEIQGEKAFVRHIETNLLFDFDDMVARSKLATSMFNAYKWFCEKNVMKLSVKLDHGETLPTISFVIEKQMDAPAWIPQSAVLDETFDSKVVFDPFCYSSITSSQVVSDNLSSQEEQKIFEGIGHVLGDLWLLSKHEQQNKQQTSASHVLGEDQWQRVSLASLEEVINNAPTSAAVAKFEQTGVTKYSSVGPTLPPKHRYIIADLRDDSVSQRVRNKVFALAMMRAVTIANSFTAAYPYLKVVPAFNQCVIRVRLCNGTTEMTHTSRLADNHILCDVEFDATQVHFVAWITRVQKDPRCMMIIVHHASLPDFSGDNTINDGEASLEIISLCRAIMCGAMQKPFIFSSSLRHVVSKVQACGVLAYTDAVKAEYAAQAIIDTAVRQYELTTSSVANDDDEEQDVPEILEQEQISEEQDVPEVLEQEQICEEQDVPEVLEQEQICEEQDVPEVLEEQDVPEVLEQEQMSEEQDVPEVLEEQEQICEEQDVPEVLEQEQISEEQDVPEVLEQEQISEEQDVPEVLEPEPIEQIQDGLAKLLINSEKID